MPEPLRRRSRSPARQPGPRTIQEYKAELLRLGVSLPSTGFQLADYQELWLRNQPRSSQSMEHTKGSVADEETSRSSSDSDLQDMSQPAIPDATDAWQGYVRIWCLMSGFDAYVWREKPALVIGGPDPLAVAHVSYLLIAAAFCFPSSRLAVSAALCARLAAFFAALPLVWDSTFWSALTDLSALLHVLGLLAPIRRTILAQMGILYLAAGLLKLNTSFLDTRYSCAPVYIVQLLDYHVLDFVPEEHHESIVAAASQVIPAVTILGESAIGALLLLAAALLAEDTAAVCTAGRPKAPALRHGVASRVGDAFALCGAGLALSLHWGIALTPPPNNISEYGAMCAVRLMWAAPAAAAIALKETCLRPVIGACYILLAAVVWHAPCFAARPDVPAVVYALLSALLGRAVYLTARPPAGGAPAPGPKARPIAVSRLAATGPQRASGGSSHRGLSGVAMLLLTTFYAFGSTTLGILDVSSPNMFSNLRQQGGSNHLFLPTSLLQRQLHLSAAAATGGDSADSPSSFIPSMYAGGVWRVGLTNSTYFRSRFPAELTPLLTARTVALLRATGHSGRMWNSAVSRVVGTFAVPPPPPLPEFVAYTLPADEVRRVLAQATAEAAATAEPFMLRLTMLEGDAAGEGGERWRTSAGGKEVEVEVDSSGRQVCSIVPSDSGTVPPSAIAATTGATTDASASPIEANSADSPAGEDEDGEANSSDLLASEGETSELVRPRRAACDPATVALLSPPTRQPWSSLLSEPTAATLSQVVLGLLGTGLSSNSYPVVPGMTEHVHCYGS